MAATKSREDLDYKLDRLRSAMSDLEDDIEQLQSEDATDKLADQRHEIARWLDGEALQYGGQVRDATELLRELARRIRSDDYR